MMNTGVSPHEGHCIHISEQFKRSNSEIFRNIRFLEFIDMTAGNFELRNRRSVLTQWRDIVLHTASSRMPRARLVYPGFDSSDCHRDARITEMPHRKLFGMRRRAR